MGPDDEDVLGPERLVDLPQSWPVHGTEDIWRGAAPFAVRRDLVSLPDHEEVFGRVVVERSCLY